MERYYFSMYSIYFQYCNSLLSKYSNSHAISTLCMTREMLQDIKFEIDKAL